MTTTLDRPAREQLDRELLDRPTRSRQLADLAEGCVVAQAAADEASAAGPLAAPAAAAAASLSGQVQVLFAELAATSPGAVAERMSDLMWSLLGQLIDISFAGNKTCAEMGHVHSADSYRHSGAGEAGLRDSRAAAGRDHD